MRPVLITLLCAFVAVPAALAAPRATGDGVLELQDVYGKVQMGSLVQPARGTLWGQVDSGTILATDPTGPGDGQILVSGWDTRTVQLADPTSPTGPRVIVYRGSDMRFRVTGGKYRIQFVNASDLNLTAVGGGFAILNGSVTAADPGTYALDSGNWLPVPLASDTTLNHRIPFGTQSTSSTTTTTTTSGP